MTPDELRVGAAYRGKSGPARFVEHIGASRLSPSGYAVEFTEPNRGSFGIWDRDGFASWAIEELGEAETAELKASLPPAYSLANRTTVIVKPVIGLPIKP